MRILVHDYAGHPFQIELSRLLAAIGHHVLHVYCGSVQTPHGDLATRETDPECFQIKALTLARQIDKNALFKRRFQEVEYGKKLAQEIEVYRPDAVISANTPIEAQEIALKACRRKGIKFIFWVQDLYSIAVHKILSRKLPIFGSMIGSYYMRIEKALLQNSDRVVLITEDFMPIMQEWNVKPDLVEVIHNWAPLRDIAVLPKQNTWAIRHGLDHKICLLYSGTLGMKHNPDLLVQLAEHFRLREDVRIVVVSEGGGAEYIRRKQEERGLPNLVVLDFQPFGDFPEMLAAADVLVAILEHDAGVFSVPSKVLSYLCAGRPLLLSVPPQNLSAKIVQSCEAGIVVPPGDAATFAAAAEILLSDELARDRMGHNARKYVEQHFDVNMIGRRFENLICS